MRPSAAQPNDGSASDPTGDIFDLFGFLDPQPSHPDITLVSAPGCTQDRMAQITVEFAAPITPPGSAQDPASAVYGLIEIDADQNQLTPGYPAGASFIDGLSMAGCPPFGSGLPCYSPNGLDGGVDFVLSLSDYVPSSGDPLKGTIPVTDTSVHASAGDASVTFGPTSYTVNIPLALLRVLPGPASNGQFNFAVMAQPITADPYPIIYQDVAPNGAHATSIACPASGVPAPALSSFGLVGLVGALLLVSGVQMSGPRR
jgi:hypothetical protein